MSNLALGAISAIDKMPTGFLSCYGLPNPGSLPTGDSDEAQSGPWF
ncbi:hypothetical protein BFJ63_vAg90 [Fusarium oxysporum f. sp. narcissi]|uniref:Uncharacterized protein n=3 Tax=Fusarium oxysporum TaxID=5507 RepID=A0A420PUE3_FUSOX|nr:hypothetical protein BFJ65_g7329 [Fusarium oxysporum f. sp. cepae]RKK96127.1 hypothetical protein BFJ71_g7992 [Fusarium oxysporum]RYC96923.1 hypothetical protein BFJ63_vAg90 [Fusarium oxysporum f. sp. narcissi]RKK63660.1 hypothetical protein BFJ66_g256 [Fusarium oxysporum f. sp. cepae]RKK65046.1 hypothetical protein BFJ67_g35 [Fusarium oxysporum f. sp. cepae]